LGFYIILRLIDTSNQISDCVVTDSRGLIRQTG